VQLSPVQIVIWTAVGAALIAWCARVDEEI
jgi:hypothetical protein